MTNHKELYKQLLINLEIIPKGQFRIADLIDNPPACVGRVFRDDVVKNKRFSNIRRNGEDEQSALYEKF